MPDDDEATVGESVVTGPNSVGIALSPPDDDDADEETDGDALPPGTVAPPDGIMVALLGLGDGVPSPVIGDNEGSILLDTFIADGAAVEGIVVGDTDVELPSVMDDDMLGLLLGAVITASVPF